MTATDWARKEISGAAIYREWTGENDEELHIRGRVFPYRVGGLTELEVLETWWREGAAQMMVRGDGYVLGWYVAERLVRGHSFQAWMESGRSSISRRCSHACRPHPAPMNFRSVAHGGAGAMRLA
jgi:phage protein U